MKKEENASKEAFDTTSFAEFFPRLGGKEMESFGRIILSAAAGTIVAGGGMVMKVV
jgi:hypothetical protein